MMNKIDPARLVLMPVDKLTESPKNRNKHSQEQIDRLAELIRYQGFRQPIIVSNLSGYIVAGHGRLAAAKQLGMTHVPIVFQDFDSTEQEYAFQVSDNAIASWAELDFSGINADLGDLGPDFDLELLAIKGFTLDALAPIDLDEKPEEEDGEKKWLIEVQFPNDMEMNDVKDDLLSRGYIVRVVK
jgi:hypothetical protein